MQRIGIFCSSSNNLDAVFYEAAGRLGTWLGEHGKTLVYGGANCGLMEVLARAVHENGGRVVGVVPQILFEQGRVSQYIDETIATENLQDRKQQLLDQSDILIALPGSVGTLDEIFTVLASNTIGLHNKRVILWNIDGYWQNLFDLLGVIISRGAGTKPFDEVLLKANTLEEVVSSLK